MNRWNRFFELAASALVLASLPGCERSMSGASRLPEPSEPVPAVEAAEDRSGLIGEPERIVFYNVDGMAELTAGDEAFGRFLNLIRERMPPGFTESEELMDDADIDALKAGQKAVEIIYSEPVQKPVLFTGGEILYDYSSIVFPLEGELSESLILSPARGGPLQGLAPADALIDALS